MVNYYIVYHRISDHSNSINAEQENGMAKFFIVTNNEMVRDKYGAQHEVEFHPVHYTEILRMVRDYVHAGHKLLTHPLAGSIKPNETPYKTVFLSKAKGSLDSESLRIIEDCIIACKKFGKDRFPQMPDDMRQDFRTIDCSLVDNAIVSAVQQ